MNDTKTLIDLVSTLEIAPAATAGNLALLPLIDRQLRGSQDPPGYLLYQHAHDMGLISIEETDAAGTVGELRVTNRANVPVLLVEGEVLLGMKQTRVLNLTILVPPEAVFTVPVSCVEAGRWHSVSEAATGKSDVHLAPSIRAAKTVTVARSMRTARTFASDQAAVWQGVDRMLDRHGVESPSDSYADLMADDPSLFSAYALGLEPDVSQVGVIACISGRVACVDVFEAPQVLATLWEGLVASYRAEALAAESAVAGPTKTRRWFRSIAKASVTVGPAIGLGAHITLVAPDLEAAALVHGGRVVHLSAFPINDRGRTTRFAAPSRRRS